MPKLEIKEQPFITSTGKQLEGTEKVVQCGLWLCNVNVRKNCSKCLKKKEISYKNGYVDCGYEVKK